MQVLQGAPVVTELLEGAGVWRRIQGTGFYVAFEGNDTLLLDSHDLTFIRVKGTTKADMHKLSLAELSQLANGQERHYLRELSVELKSHLMKVLIPEKVGISKKFGHL